MPPTPVASEYQKACSAVPTCPLASSRTKPVARANRSTDEPAPSLHPDYRGFVATTSRSASGRRDGTQRLTVPAARRAPSRHRPLPGPWLCRRPPSHVPCRSRRPDSRRLHAGQDTTWPINGHPPGSSRRHLTAPVLMSAACFDTSTADRSRSPSRSPPDALVTRLLLNAHHDGLQPTQLEVV